MDVINMTENPNNTLSIPNDDDLATNLTQSQRMKASLLSRILLTVQQMMHCDTGQSINGNLIKLFYMLYLFKRKLLLCKDIVMDGGDVER